MSNLWRSILDVMMPRACAMCGQRLDVEEEVVCSTCFLQLPRTGFEAHAEDNDMARLFWGRIKVERVAALFYYQSQSPASHIMYDMKYHQHPEACYEMGRLVAQEFMPHQFFHDVDMLIPVPLNSKRQRHRGYNQSEEIAKGVSSVTHIAVEKHAVERILHTESQTQKAYDERMENVEGAFRLRKPSLLKGKHILLIDDVVTSGATTIACGREILKVPDTRLNILSIGFTKE